jgi:hypothetical protein
MFELKFSEVEFVSLCGFCVGVMNNYVDINIRNHSGVSG